MLRTGAPSSLQGVWLPPQPFWRSRLRLSHHREAAISGTSSSTRLGLGAGPYWHRYWAEDVDPGPRPDPAGHRHWALWASVLGRGSAGGCQNGQSDCAGWRHGQLFMIPTGGALQDMLHQTLGLRGPVAPVAVIMTVRIEPLLVLLLLSLLFCSFL